jgi:hypothetical protein
MQGFSKLASGTDLFILGIRAAALDVSSSPCSPMNPNGQVSPSRTFYRLGSVCCIYYVVAQLIQEITFHLGLDGSATGQAEILQRLMPLDQFRQVLILLGFSFIPIMTAYAGVALRRYHLRPAASVLGLGFAFGFVGTEVSIRAIDLFLVSRNWAVQYQAAASETIRQEIAGRIQVWDESVGALYFALLGAHLLSSVCFAMAIWDSNDKWSLVAAVGFGLTAIECAGRILEGYLGQTWLSGANYAAYFPIVFLSLGALAVWLWRQAPSASVKR